MFEKKIDPNEEPVVNDSEDIVLEEDSESKENLGADYASSVNKIQEKLKKALEEKQSYLDAWQRDKADFLNARKRDKEEREQVIKFANEGLVSDLTAVLQSFDMAFANKELWEKADKSWRDGMVSIYNQFKQILESRGLKEINPIGIKFDAQIAESIGNISTNNKKEDHLILEVFQKGYSLNDKVIKPAKVRIGEYVDKG